ncbi:MAG: CDP-alcohol phosphatidyltransferase family protein, partial [Candidatus Bipolaricaulia bacterium]
GDARCNSQSVSRWGQLLWRGEPFPLPPRGIVLCWSTTLYCSKMTLANIITSARLALIPVIIALLLGGATAAAFALFLLFLIGDLADGALARARREVTETGKLLDPLADKLLSAGLLATFAALGKISWLAFALLVLQQFGLLGGTVLLARRGALPGAKVLGKAAAAVISLGLALAFFTVPGYSPVIYLGIALSYLAGIDYLRLARRRAREQTRRAAGR